MFNLIIKGMLPLTTKKPNTLINIKYIKKLIIMSRCVDYMHIQQSISIFNELNYISANLKKS